MDAETFFDHEIDHNPKPEDAGAIKIYASIVGIFDPARRCPTSPVLSRTEQFRREARHGGGNQVLKAFLIDAGINAWVLFDLNRFIDEIVILRREYSPRCSLTVRMTVDPIVEEAPVFFNSTTPVTKVAVRIYTDKTSCICDTCSICLDEFGTGERVVTLPCDHVFHDQCIFPCFKTSLVCPLCRFKLALV